LPEAQAWEITALACNVLGGMGAYCVPHDNNRLKAFLVLHRVVYRHEG
jgi:hypothetical protein